MRTVSDYNSGWQRKCYQSIQDRVQQKSCCLLELLQCTQRSWMARDEVESSLAFTPSRASSLDRKSMGQLPRCSCCGSWSTAMSLFSLQQEILCCCSAAAAAKSLQSCPTLCDPIDGSPPGPPIPGILQARTLEWVAISFSNA